MVYIQVDQAGESTYSNINPTDPLHVVRKINLPFVIATAYRAVLTKVDLVSSLQKNLANTGLRFTTSFR